MQKILNYLLKYKILIFVIVLYLLLSLIVVSFRKSFWFDELFTLEVVKADVSRFIILVIGDGKPPLYYTLVKFYSLLFNNQTESFLRLSSIVLAVPFIVYAYKLLFEFTSKKKAILITFVLTFNPFFLVYSSEFRMYSMLASSTMIFVYYYYKSSVLNDIRYQKKYFFSKLLLIFTHYIGLFILFAELVIKLISSLKIRIEKYRQTKKLNLIFELRQLFLQNKSEILFFAISFTLIYLQTKLFPNFSIYWVSHFDLTSIPNSFLVFFLGLDAGAGGKSIPLYYETISSQLPMISTLIYLLLIFLSIIIIKAKSKIKPIITLMSLSITIIILNSTNLSTISFYMERYMIGILLVLLLCTLVIVAISSKKIFVFLIILLSCLNLLFLYNIFTGKVFTSYDSSAQKSIDYWYKEELDRCGWFYFDKIKRCV